jgi:hypothetical protein
LTSAIKGDLLADYFMREWFGADAVAFTDPGIVD